MENLHPLWITLKDGNTENINSLTKKKIMTYEFTVSVTVEGSATEQELRDFISFEVGASCSIDQDNPFMCDSDSEITNIDLI